MLFAVVPELLLLVVLSAAAFGGSFLLKEHRKSKQAEREERRRAEEAGAQEAARQEARFRDAVVRELRKTNLLSFRLAPFAARLDVPPEVAAHAAESIFVALCRKCTEDGVVTHEERRRLELTAAAFAIPPARAAELDRSVKGQVYRSAVEAALSDGVVTEEEAAGLESLRESLRIEGAGALDDTRDVSIEAYLATLSRIVLGGPVGAESREALARMRRGLAISDRDAATAIRQGASDLFRECFAMAVQDGEVSPDERESLEWLQAEAGMTPEEMQPYRRRLEEVDRLAGFRRGNLPSVSASKIPGSGEICHWQGPCMAVLSAAKRDPVHRGGTLLLTSKNVIFSSPTKTFSFSPSKIIDVGEAEGFVMLETSPSTWAGKYYVEDSGTVGAIVTGLVRKHKFLVGGTTSGAKTRHIPHEVKVEVWARDGGRCVSCQASDYLEYDHIIPHARGGANTVGNVQLLCRRCNGLKGDRI